MNIKLLIAYDGTPFLGWQKTKNNDTPASVEEALEKALETILQHKVKLQAASRTDAGVHAEGQVVNFFLEKPFSLKSLCYKLNCLLPKEISVLSAEEMASDFHPTLMTKGKEYWYHLCNGPIQNPFFRATSWHFPYPLAIDLMKEAAQEWLGTHDFSSFCNERQEWDRNPICHLEKIDILLLEGDRLRFCIRGDHFLYKMVRNLVGTLAYVGCGKLSLEEAKFLLDRKDRTFAGMTAPAHGLTLKEVLYV